MRHTPDSVSLRGLSCSFLPFGPSMRRERHRSIIAFPTACPGNKGSPATLPNTAPGGHSNLRSSHSFASINTPEEGAGASNTGGALSGGLVLAGVTAMTSFCQRSTTSLPKLPDLTVDFRGLAGGAGATHIFFSFPASCHLANGAQRCPFGNGDGGWSLIRNTEHTEAPPRDSGTLQSLCGSAPWRCALGQRGGNEAA